MGSKPRMSLKVFPDRRKRQILLPFAALVKRMGLEIVSGRSFGGFDLEFVL